MTTNTTALARRFRLDVTNDLTLAAGFIEAKGMYAFKPAVDPNLVNTGAYDTDGWDSFEKTSQGWSLTGSFWLRAPAGIFDAGVQMLRDRQMLWGDACRIGVRWYDKSGQPEAYAGVAIVKSERANDGKDDPDAVSITLTGDGALSAITNPGTAPAVPTITGATPSAQVAGKTVTITGSGFTGTVATTGVKFNAISAPDWQVVSDQVIVAVMPAGSAGVGNIIVTNAVGASTAFAYNI